MMERRRCGKTGLELPLMGIGCWSFGGGDYWGSQDQSDVDRVVALGVERGCSYFDTAEVYNDGASESSLGKAVRKVPRDSVLIGTKIRPENASAQGIRDHLDASLERLKTDYVDVYMLHYPIEGTDESNEAVGSDAEAATKSDFSVAAPTPDESEALAALADLRTQGKIRHIGVSNYGPEQLSRILQQGVEIAVNQVAYGLLMRAVESAVLPACVEAGVGVMGYMPLMQGLLAGKYAAPEEVPPERARTRHYSGDRPGARHGGPGIEREVFEFVDWLRSLSGETGLGVADLSLAWCAQNPAVTCVLVGVRNEKQMEANMRSFSLKLDPEVARRLDEKSRPILEALGDSADYWESWENRRSR